LNEAKRKMGWDVDYALSYSQSIRNTVKYYENLIVEETGKLDGYPT